MRCERGKAPSSIQRYKVAREAAQKAMNDFVAKIGEAVLTDIEEVARLHYPEFPEIRRISCQATARDCVFGAGEREPGLDGRIIPFGVAQSRY